MSLEISAKTTWDSIKEYVSTTPAQSNRGRFRDVVANAVSEGMLTARDLKQFGLTNQDVGNAMKGKPIDIEASRRAPIIEFLRIKSQGAPTLSR